MSAAKHTPGPWKVISEQTAREVEVFEIAEISHYRVIRDARGDGFDAQGHDLADARLIAAAPELLEALRGALKALDAIGDEMTVGERYTNAGQYLLDSLTPARAAIAKATGEPNV